MYKRKPFSNITDLLEQLVGESQVASDHIVRIERELWEALAENIKIAKELTGSRAENALLKDKVERCGAALDAIEQGTWLDSGSFWPMRNWLDEQGVYHGDVSDVYVFGLVARTALLPEPPVKQGEEKL